MAEFSKAEVDAYEESLKSYRDLKNSLDTAREEGKFEEKRQTVLKSHKASLSIDVISSITDLSVKEIERIINEG